MRRILTAVMLGLALAAPAAAQDGMRQLETADDTRGLEAVGRLDIGNRSFCTATLIAPDYVLTAGHCLYDSKTGAPVDIRDLEFLAGWRDGRAVAYRGVRRAILHPDYTYEGRSGEATRVVNDLALLELSQPIRNGITPLATGQKPRKGDPVGVLSYAFDRDARPSLEEVCDVLARPEGMLIISCTVDFGSSGAPILVFDEDIPRVVSVVSAKAEAMGRPVSLGTELTDPLATLLDMADQGDGVFGKPRMINGGGAGGARFVRP